MAYSEFSDYKSEGSTPKKLTIKKSINTKFERNGQKILILNIGLLHQKTRTNNHAQFAAKNFVFENCASKTQRVRVTLRTKGPVIISQPVPLRVERARSTDVFVHIFD
jgi:hypothetical protein